VRTFTLPFLALLLFAAAPASAPTGITVESLLARRAQALAAMHVVQPRTLEVRGTLTGLGSSGTFHSWRAANRWRYDEALGPRTRQTVRIGDVTYLRNVYGDVRNTGPATVLRQRTQDSIESNDFMNHPENAVSLGKATLTDGRAVYRLRVQVPGGDPYGVALDAATWMIDETVSPDGTGVATVEYYDYAVTNGALYARRFVESAGDGDQSLTSIVTDVGVDRPIDASVFAVPQSVRIDAATPVTVPLLSDKGLQYVRASANGKPLLLLLDSGSQGIVLAPQAADRLGIIAQGTIEIRGARNTQGAGVAPLDAIEIGAARLPVNAVTVVDLNGLTLAGKEVDGVLGFPFFAAAEIRIDPEKSVLTIAQPGSLSVLGTPIPLETNRDVPEIIARINNRIDGRFVVDTGNNSDLLVFHAFEQANPGVIFYGQARTFASNRGVGGSSAAVPAIVDRLQIGPFSLYNRYANIILQDRGAFADGADAGNIGFGSLRNFIVTFDDANHTLYLEKAHWFDDGRYRPQYDPNDFRSR
jgi:Aspartyl protease